MSTEHHPELFSAAEAAEYLRVEPEPFAALCDRFSVRPLPCPPKPLSRRLMRPGSPRPAGADLLGRPGWRS